MKTRNLIQQTCEARSITLLSGHVSKDHDHIHVSCPPELAPSKIAQYIKGRSSRLIQQEFSHLRKRYWGSHLWALGYFCAIVGKVTEQMIAAYIEQQESAHPKDIITVAEEKSASAEMTDFQS